MVKYICTKCGTQFDAPQGSKRKLCPKCLVDAVTAGKKKE